ncbi:hypothetical protein ABE253_09685 [Bacillus subtilis]
MGKDLLREKIFDVACYELEENVPRIKKELEEINKRKEMLEKKLDESLDFVRAACNKFDFATSYFPPKFDDSKYGIGELLFLDTEQLNDTDGYSYEDMILKRKRQRVQAKRKGV